MEKLLKLRARVKELVEANDVLITKDVLDAADLKAMNDNSAAIDAATAEITTLEKALEQKAKAAIPATGGTSTGTQERTEPKVKQPETAVEKIGAMVKGLVAHNLNKGLTPIAHLDAMGYGALASEIVNDQKILNTTSAVSGGLLVPSNESREIIELLRPQTAFLRGNPRRIPMPNGNYSQPAVATGATASYTGEGENAPVTEETFAEINMSAKKLAALVPVTNELLAWNDMALAQFIQSDLRDALAEKMDAMMFRGDGAAGNPLGIFNIPGVVRMAATNTATPTSQQIDADLRRMLNAMTLIGINLANCAWVIPAANLGYLEDLREDGAYVYETARGPNRSIKNLPILDTTNLPSNLGSQFNESEIALVKFDQVLFGETSGLELASSNEAMIEIGGAKLSLFQRGMTAIMAVMRHDVTLRRKQAVVVMTGIKWGR